MDYELELERAVDAIRQRDAARVCIQLPDGLKPHAEHIVQYLEEHTEASIIVWSGSCFGSCDVPLELERFDIDLLIQWGHS